MKEGVGKMKCIKCGIEYDEGAFCPECGMKNEESNIVSK